MELHDFFIVAAGLALGVVSHIVKKVIEEREIDTSFSLRRYVTEKPYKTFMVCVYAIGGAAALYNTGDLGFASALITGAAANSFSGKGAG